MSERLLDVNGVAAKLGLSKSLVWRLAGGVDFPKPVRIESATRWLDSELDAWIQARASERRAS